MPKRPCAVNLQCCTLQKYFRKTRASRDEMGRCRCKQLPTSRNEKRNTNRILCRRLPLSREMRRTAVQLVRRIKLTAKPHFKKSRSCFPEARRICFASPLDTERKLRKVHGTWQHFALTKGKSMQCQQRATMQDWDLSSQCPSRGIHGKVSLFTSIWTAFSQSLTSSLRWRERLEGA